MIKRAIVATQQRLSTENDAVRTGILLVLCIMLNVVPGFRSVASPPNEILRGRVIDSISGEPFERATIYVPDLKRGVLSHDDGSFEIADLPKGTHTLIVRYVGYEEKIIRLSVLGDTTITVRLSPKKGSTSITKTGKRRSETMSSSRSTTEISESQLQRTRGQTLGESLKDLPGVTLLQTGPSISKPVIRGLHSQRVLVVNGEVSQEGQQWGSEHAPEIDPFAPAAIQVLRGAAGVEYGAGAIGGVIRLAPRPLPTIPGLDGEFNLNAFSNNLQASGSLMLEGTTSLLPGVGIRLQGSARKAGDASTADYVIGNSGFQEVNGAVMLGYHDERFGTDITYSHFGTELGIFRGSHVNNAADLQQAIAAGRPQADYQFGYTIAPPKQVISHDLFSLGSHYTLPGAGRFELQYGYQRNQRQEFDAHNARLVNDTAGIAGQRASFDLRLTTSTLTAKYRHTPVDGLYGTIGFDGMLQENVRAGTVKLIPSFRSYGGGLYLIENFETGDWILNAGARFDLRRLHVFPIPSRSIVDQEREYSNLTAAVGVTYQLGEEWSLGMNVGTAWRPPSVNELFSNDVHHGAAQFEIGDVSLRNERSINIDGTLKFNGEKCQGELSIYNNSFTDFIYLRPEAEPTVTIRGTYPTFRYRQSNAVLRGIDGSFSYQLSEALRLGVALSVIRGDNLETGEPLISMPADRLQFNAHLDLPGVREWITEPYLEASTRLVRRQDRYPAGDYAPPPPGYSLLDLDAGAKLLLLAQPVALSLSVQNVFNIAYRDYLSRFRYYSDDPGRNIILRIALPIGGYQP